MRCMVNVLDVLFWVCWNWIFQANGAVKRLAVSEGGRRRRLRLFLAKSLEGCVIFAWRVKGGEGEGVNMD